MLEVAIAKGEIISVPDMDDLIQEISNKRWNVRNEYPTADTEILERYLARYINRIAISKSRLEYLGSQQKLDAEVNITYKDYHRQVKGQAAPLAIKTLQPLSAIHQFLVHALPPYFQKSRYYGLHAAPTFKRFKDKIPKKLTRNTDTIRIICSIITQMMNLKSHKCELCQGQEFVVTPLRSDSQWIFQFITLPSYRGPPKVDRNTKVEF